MTIRFQKYWQPLQESLWFVPGLMVLSSFGLAYGLIAFDVHTSWQGQKQLPLLFGTGADGARSMLVAISSSMLTVAALAFSLTLTTITQVSSQYSPRVLRNFMRDRINQVVMGYFVSVFAYCLIVLGTIRGTDEVKFVPATAVLAGLILALGGVAALIFFIHHIAESLQSGTIVQHIFRETSSAIDDLFPGHLGQPIDNPAQAEAALRYSDEEVGWEPVRARQTGYLQRIETEGLLRWATRHRVVLRIEHDMGAFINEGSRLFSVRSGMERPDPTKADWPDDLMAYVSIGRHRNVEQDVAFGIQQLVDIALKALSPGINDTTTAIMAIDYLGATMGRLAGRDFPTWLRSDGQHLRVITRTRDFETYVRLAFDLPRLNAKGNHAVLGRLLRALTVATDAACSPDRKPVLVAQVRLLMDDALQTLTTEDEKESVRVIHDQLMTKANALR